MKKKIFTFSGWVVACFLLLILIITNNKDNYILENSSKKKDGDTLSMMYETNPGSGEYTTSNNSKWMGDSYSFNKRLSKCENGGTLSWDSATNQVIMTGDKSDKCYVYFNKTANMADYIKSLYTTDGENNLYYHDGIGSYTNASLEAGDNSYRYAGSNETTNNYVCFGTSEISCPAENLYRIIGVFDDDGDGVYNVKLISANFATSTMLGDGSVSEDYVGEDSVDELDYPYRGILNAKASYHWNNENYDLAYNETGYYNDWSYSSLNTKHLNDYYLNTYLGNQWGSKIRTTTWKVGGNTWTNISSEGYAKSAYSYEITNPSTQVASTYNSKVGLMYVSDYYYAASPTYWSYPGSSSNGASYDYRAAIDFNWLYLAGAMEWTLTRQSASSSASFGIPVYGYISAGYVNSSRLAVRPTFYLNSDVVLNGGIGTATNPYTIAV